MSLQNLFVAKLPRNLTDADLQSIFAAYKPSSAKIMLDATTGKSKGFGFVLFDSEERGGKAYNDLNKTHVTLHGHSFNLCVFPSKHDGKVATEEGNALYIRNIPRNMAQLQVEQFLRSFGNLIYCAMREDHHGVPVWVVYAEYDTVEAARNALTKLHGSKQYFDYPAAVLAKFADSEEAKRERRKRREVQITDMPAAPGGSPSGMAGHQGGGTASPPPPCFAQGPMHHYQDQPHSGSVVVGVGAKNGTGSPAPPPPPPPPPVNGGGGGIVPLSSSFLNVTFPTVAANHSQSTHSFSHFSQTHIEPSPNGRGSPCTPLSFSFNNGSNSNMMDGAIAAAEPYPNTQIPVQAISSNNNNCNAQRLGVDYQGNSGNNSFAPVTPVRRSSNLSAVSGTYRHNPYAPVTPISSATSSAGPTSPLTGPIQNPTGHNAPATMHFGYSHYQPPPPPQQQQQQPQLSALTPTVSNNNNVSAYAGGGHFGSPVNAATTGGKTFLTSTAVSSQ